METWYEGWNIKINEDKTQGIYFARSRRPPEFHLTLNGRNIPFVYSVRARHQDRLTDRQSQCDFDSDFDFDPGSVSWEFSSVREAVKKEFVARMRLWKENFMCDIWSV
jgi:hypothetical protein